MPQEPLEQLIRAGEVTGEDLRLVRGHGRVAPRRDPAGPRAVRSPPPVLRSRRTTADLSQLFSDLDLTVSRPMDARAVEKMLSAHLSPRTALPEEPATVPAATKTTTTRSTAVASASRKSRRTQHDEEDLEASGLAAPQPGVEGRRWRCCSCWPSRLAGLYALSTLQVFPLEVPQVDPATGAR